MFADEKAGMLAQSKPIFESTCVYTGSNEAIIKQKCNSHSTILSLLHDINRDVKRVTICASERGKARLKRSGPKEKPMVKPWVTMEDQYGKAAASRLSPF